MSNRKRHSSHSEDRHRYESRKRPHAASPDAASPDAGARSGTPPRKRAPTFPSYLDAPDLSPKVRLLCEILATTPSHSVELALDDTGVRVTPDDVEEVLKLSYAHPGPAVKFFRWSGTLLHHLHSPYSWNLLVDLLGKNLLFDAMWDAVSSMRSERLLSLATFASIFSSFAAASRPDDALAAFDDMEARYGVPRDAPALNTLLSALCREGLTTAARASLARARRSSLPPDPDTYAILLEGCENERDPHGAREVFGEMISLFGWDPANVPAYDSFLTTLVHSASGVEEALKLVDSLLAHRCYPGMKFFRAALQRMTKDADARGAHAIWNKLAGSGCNPDTPMYNSMISLQCFVNQTELAHQLLDDMIMYGAFPDAQTYNVMLQFLLKGRKLGQAAAIFKEMVKNEFCPTEANCTMALKIFLDTWDWDMGTKVWKCMLANDIPPLEENANMLILKLSAHKRLPEACKLAEEMIDRGIKLNSSTLSVMKSGLSKVGKGNIYDDILRKWKGRRD